MVSPYEMVHMSVVWYGIDFIDFAKKAEKNQHSDRALTLLQKSTLTSLTLYQIIGTLVDKFKKHKNNLS